MGAFRFMLKAGLAIGAVAGLALAGFTLAAEFNETVAPGARGAPVDGGDVELTYSAWGPQDGFPVVLVHGSFAWSQTWDVIAPALATRGYRVIALDIPPFGYSGRPADSSYSRGDQARRILSAADALGLSSFALVGHSFGAGATVEAAFEAPARVRGLALLGAALRLDDPSGGGPVAIAASLPVLGRSLAAATFVNPMLTRAGLEAFVHDKQVVTPERVALYQVPLEVEGTAQAVAGWVAAGLYGDESSALSADPARYRAFTRPTLLVWGLEDTVTPIEQARTLAGLLPQARLTELERVGHIPHLEAPAAVAEALGVFLDAIAKDDP